MADTKWSALATAGAAAAADYLMGLQSGAAVKQQVSALATYMWNAPQFAAGSASAGSWPTIGSGTVLTSPVAGTWEYDGTNLFFTPATSNRGIVPVTHFIRQHADSAAKANDTAQHAIFDSVANGTLTLPVGAYTFEALIQCKGMSATSGNMKWSLKGAGNATIAVVLQEISGVDGAVDSPATRTGTSLIAEIATAQIMPSAVGTVATIHVRGSFECTGAGTIIPSLAQFTAVTTAVITAGSYFRCTRMGAASSVSAGNWS